MKMRGKITLALPAAVFFLGMTIAFLRFEKGLGATTALSDDVPWGLWIAVKLCFIAMAAGAFCLATVVYLLRMERYRPLLRPAVLTGLLFYTMFLLALLLDLGRPLRIWHPLVMWQHHSVLFEVSWCMMLYSAVLAVEFSPAVWERFGPERIRRLVHALVVPLVIIGAVLSVLHQSSLGSLFLVVPGKLHPLWYSPLLPVFFFLSAVGCGLGVVILVTIAGSKIRGRHASQSLLQDLARAASWVIVSYGLLRIGDLISRGAADGQVSGILGWLIIAELALGVLVPAVLFAWPRSRANTVTLIIASGSLIAGTCLNRFNVSLLGMTIPQNAAYFPTWMEIGCVAGIIGFGILAFAIAARYLRVFPDEFAFQVENPEAPAKSPLYL